MTLADRIAIMRDGVIQQLDNPHAIYNRPKNLFVAGFIGSPGMNFIKGDLTAGAEPVFTAGSISIPLKAYHFETAPPAGPTHAVLGIRPEHVAIRDAAGQLPFSMDAEIDIVEPMGSDTVAWVKVADQPFTIRCESEVVLSAGQKLRIGFDPARGSLFNAETGNRL
jgi:multiple sugar transport system ATP-binding protein